MRASKDQKDDKRGIDWDSAWTDFKSTAKRGASKILTLLAMQRIRSVPIRAVRLCQASLRQRRPKRRPLSRVAAVLPACRKGEPCITC